MLEWGVDVEIDALVAIARREPGKRLEPGDEVGTAIGIARIVERVDADAYILRAPRLCEAERQRQEDEVAGRHIGDGNLVAHAILRHGDIGGQGRAAEAAQVERQDDMRSEEHTSEPQSLMRTSYAV